MCQILLDWWHCLTIQHCWNRWRRVIGTHSILWAMSPESNQALAARSKIYSCLYRYHRNWATTLYHGGDFSFDSKLTSYVSFEVPLNVASTSGATVVIISLRESFLKWAVILVCGLVSFIFWHFIGLKVTALCAMCIVLRDKVAASIPCCNVAL